MLEVIVFDLFTVLESADQRIWFYCCADSAHWDSVTCNPDTLSYHWVSNCQWTLFLSLKALFSGVVSTKMKDMRLYAMSVCCIPPIIGTVLVHTLPTSHAWGRVVSLWLTYTNSVSLAVSFAVLGGNVTGFTKKNTVTFLLFVGYCSGSIASPQFFLSSEEARGYPTGIKTMIACFCIQLVLPLLLRVLYVNENKKRDALARDGEIQSDVNDDEDATDWERKTFRYLL
jgi:hypothetical protein